jgi:hypothetical protein
VQRDPVVIKAYLGTDAVDEDVDELGEEEVI